MFSDRWTMVQQSAYSSENFFVPRTKNPLVSTCQAACTGPWPVSAQAAACTREAWDPLLRLLFREWSASAEDPLRLLGHNRQLCPDGLLTRGSLMTFRECLVSDLNQFGDFLNFYKCKTKLFSLKVIPWTFSSNTSIEKKLNVAVWPNCFAAKLALSLPLKGLCSAASSPRGFFRKTCTFGITLVSYNFDYILISEIFFLWL